MTDFGGQLPDEQLLEEDAGVGILVGRQERQHLGEQLRRELVTKAGKVQQLRGALGRSEDELLQEPGLDGGVLVVGGRRLDDVVDEGGDLRVEAYFIWSSSMPRRRNWLPTKLNQTSGLCR